MARSDKLQIDMGTNIDEVLTKLADLEAFVDREEELVGSRNDANRSTRSSRG